MSDRATFVSFLLDETGSMQSIKDDTIGGFNSYLETLQEAEAEIVFSLVTFNSNGTKRRYVAEPVKEVRPLTAEDYTPQVSTPLIDATVKIIQATAEAVEHRGDDPRVVVVVQTDGRENVSVQYTRADLAQLVKEKTEAGWEFVFLGAGLDAFEAARSAGIDLPAGQAVSYGRARSGQVFASTAANLKEYAEFGDSVSLSYTPEQREEAGDEYTHRHLGRASAPAPAAPRPGRARPKPPTTADDIDLTKDS